MWSDGNGAMSPADTCCGAPGEARGVKYSRGSGMKI